MGSRSAESPTSDASNASNASDVSETTRNPAEPSDTQKNDSPDLPKNDPPNDRPANHTDAVEKRSESATDKDGAADPPDAGESIPGLKWLKDK